MQAGAPDALNEPAAQVRQVVLLLAPFVGPYVPAAQEVRLKDAQKEPRGHKRVVMSRMRWLVVSATYKLPAASTATLRGNCAETIFSVERA